VDGFIVVIGRGSGGKNVIFSITPQTTFLSVLNCSTMCQYDILKVSFKILSGRGPSGVSKLTCLRFGTGSGLGCRIFGGF
jgi:hypothetical protein